MGAGRVTRDEIVKRPFVRADTASLILLPNAAPWTALRRPSAWSLPTSTNSAGQRSRSEPRHLHQSTSVRRRFRSVRSVEACKPNAIVAPCAKVRAPRCQFRRKSVFVKRSEQTGFRALIEPVSGHVHSRQNAAEDRDWALPEHHKVARFRTQPVG